jgi:RNA polymerase sigma-70 factor, ECF subfamily
MELADSVADLEALPVALDALDERFELARPRLVRLCASLVGEEQAEDVVQETYLVARRGVGQLHNPEAIEAWLKRISVNLCYDLHRRRRRLVERLPRLVRENEVVGRNLALREMVERLPPRQRTVIVLFYAYGYGLDEIAELLSLSHTNVRSIIARTRRRLLAEWLEEGR